MANKISVDPNLKASRCKTLWRIKSLRSFDKNIIYCFLMNSYLDKQDKWLKNLVLHPLCFQCTNEFESFDHLLLHCKTTEGNRRSIGISSWKSILSSNTQLKFLVATIISSWTEKQGEYLKYLREHYMA